MTTLPPTRQRATERTQNHSPSDVEPPRPPEPSALGPLRPVVDRWLLVLVVTLLFVGGAVFAGLSRAPTHRAEAEINVGRTDVRVQALPGYVAGASALANAYSRVVESDRIVDRIAAATDRPPAEVEGALTAVPVPENPILRITGEGASSREAVALTTAATTELERYVARTDGSRSDLDETLDEFRRQSRRAAELRRELNRLENAPVAPAVPGETVEEPTADEEAALRVAYETAKLRADSLGQSYRERQSELFSTAGIEVISRPAAVGDDQRTVLQRLIAVAVVAGLIVGSALALMLGARAARRRRRVA